MVVLESRDGPAVFQAGEEGCRGAEVTGIKLQEEVGRGTETDPES